MNEPFVVLRVMYSDQRFMQIFSDSKLLNLATSSINAKLCVIIDLRFNTFAAT